MHTKFLLAAVMLSLTAYGTSPTFAATWKCSAPGLISGNYDGGSTAYIHLEGFGRGNSYTVRKSKNGKVASGVTGNNTRFTCRQR